MLDRSIAPAFGEIEHLDLVQPKSYDLGDGRIIHFIDGGSSGVIKLEVVLKTGVWHEKTPGLSWFTVNMLREGTASYSAQDIANILDYHGAFLEITPGFDNVSIVLLCTKTGFQEPLKAFKEMLLKPSFPETELETLKNIRSQQINVGNAKNSFIASRKIRSLLFGEEHPYGRSLETEQIPTISSDDLKEYYQTTFLSSPEFFVSGDVSSDELKLIGEAFVSIQESDTVSIGKNPGFLAPSHLNISKEGSLQSSIRMALQMPAKNHSDYFKILLTNEILGGYFGSRLMKNLREEKGYTYGVQSHPLYLKQHAFLIISTDVTSKSTEDAIHQIKLEMDILERELVSEDELETVKNYMAGSFLSAVSTPFDLMDRFKSIHFHGLDYGHYDRYFSALKSISAQDILDTSKKYFNQETLYQVVVG